jgi:4-amino-4-deoxy-L-arabinose transferase-like glycosyltransferase
MRPQLTVRHGSSAWLLYVGAALYVLTFIVLYPRTFAIVDEDAYLTQTFLFRAGRLSYEGSGIPAPHMTVETAGRAVSKYPPGNALFLLPFTLFGWRAVFVSGLLLALAGTCLFRLILRRLAPEADPAWSLLYLFYPAVVLFSRTIMSDLLAATLVLAAFYCLLRSGAGARMSADAHGRARMALVSGLVLGLACLVRYSNAVFVPVFLALLAGVARTNTDEHGRIRRAMLLFVAGFAPPAGLTLAYNAYAYGAPFSFPMYLTGHFSPAYFFHNAWYYGTCLLMLYPLMLVAPLGAGKGLRLLLGLPAGVLLVLYCFFSYTYDVPDLPARLTIGIRYLLPALPFFVLAFVVTADRLTRSRLAEVRGACDHGAAQSRHSVAPRPLPRGAGKVPATAPGQPARRRTAFVQQGRVRVGQLRVGVARVSAPLRVQRPGPARFRACRQPAAVRGHGSQTRPGEHGGTDAV